MDHALFVQAAKHTPIESLPGPVIIVEREIEQRQRCVVDLFGIEGHREPLAASWSVQFYSGSSQAQPVRTRLSWRNRNHRVGKLADLSAVAQRAKAEGEVRRHCEHSGPIHSCFAALWIASRSLSSGAHSRDPVARNCACSLIR